MIHLPLEQIAYSIPSSYLTMKLLTSKTSRGEVRRIPEGFYLRIVHGIGRRPCFNLIPIADGKLCSLDEFEIDMTPAGVTFTHPAGKLYLTFEDVTTMVARGEGLGLRMDMPIDEAEYPYEYVARYTDSRLLVNSSTSRTQFMLVSHQGRMEVDAPYGQECCKYIHVDFLPDETGVIRLTAEHFETVWKERGYQADALASMEKNRRTFEAFCAPFPEPPARFAETMELSLYTFWSAVVRPAGMLKRPGMLMSNNHMIGIWTWDSAINAMGLSFGQPELGYDQLMTPFDFQTEEGLLPDYVIPYEIMWNFTKPPVHGIALNRFYMDKLTDAQLEDILVKFSKQVDYWLTYTDSDGDGVCQYNHGNDCGWDNCTPFEVGAPVEGPDLNSYLVLEMHALGDACAKLGREAEAAEWHAKGDAMLARLIEHCWDGDKFRVYQSGTHRQNPRGESLYHYLPLVLGHHLPKEIYNKMISDLKRPDYLLTDYGFATESVSSPCYSPDGYWRGPIWAPPMLLLILGIADGGDVEFARLLADRFCSMCAMSGLAENFNALTGEGLRDRAYTWTASAFIILACFYASKD